MQIAAHRRWIAENFLVLPLIALVAGMAAYWVMILDRVPPIDLTEGRIVPSKVLPGADVTAFWEIDRLRPGTYSVVLTRVIIDSTGVVWRKEPQYVYERAYPPDRETIARSIQVPFAAAWGSARYRVEACFRKYGFSLTQFFPICVQEDDLPFEIMPPPKPPQEAQ